MTTTTKIAGEAMTNEQIDAIWDQTLTKCDGHISHRAFARALFASKPAVPEGWKLVPVERSYDMRVKAIIAFNTAEQSGKDRDDALDAAWQAMLSVAPTAAPEKGDGRDAWISVDERLPEERQVVLVFRPDAHLLPACDPNIDCRCYFGNGVFNGIHPVTHWMPLPAPPAALYQKANDGLSLRAQHEDACIAANNNAQDAERYRWLRTLDSDFGNRNRMSEMARFYGETLDEAIDAALSQKAGEQQ